jgi:hypothetical protein
MLKVYQEVLAFSAFASAGKKVLALRNLEVLARYLKTS